MYIISCTVVTEICKTGRVVQEIIKKHERDVRLARTQTSEVSEHANKNGHSPNWENIKCPCRLHHNINRDIGIEILG